MALIEDFETRFVLGIRAMDRNHREFVQILDQMAEATNATFIYLYPALLQLTRAHFASEEVLMERSRFAAMNEHINEHRHVLEHMEHFARHLFVGQLHASRTFVREWLPDWFCAHHPLDHALARHLHISGFLPASA